jgi:hypothetical protein
MTQNDTLPTGHSLSDQGQELRASCLSYAQTDWEVLDPATSFEPKPQIQTLLPPPMVHTPPKRQLFKQKTSQQAMSSSRSSILCVPPNHSALGDAGAAAAAAAAAAQHTCAAVHAAARCLLLRLSLHMLCGPLSLADGIDTIQHKCAPFDAASGCCSSFSNRQQ